MKKNLFLLIAVVLCGTLFSQEIPKLKLTREGVAPVVLKVDGLSASEIYKKSLDWVQETYQNPEYVLKANIENKKIRIEGFEKNAFVYKAIASYKWGVNYTLEISFKDGRCRYDYNINYFTGHDDTRTGVTYKNFFRNNGEIRDYSITSVFSLNKSMNDFLLNYYNYITGKADAEDDDW